ncbi:MAG TPA: hypothetical protein VKA43_07995 [Gammaproteobacteria bacterium]|nr:hypothetical protein [Gammaproteobacteria bacterium]
MFKRIRIAFLLYVLLFVAVAQFFAGQRSKDWDEPLWVDVYVVAGDSNETTRRYLDNLDPTEFKDVQPFLAREAGRYGVTLEQPFRVRLVGEHRAPLPTLSRDVGALGVLWWSLRMRWLAARLRWQADGPSGDVLVFAVFHMPSAGVALDGSTALKKGLIAVANLFAARDARATNQIVLAHELLHTLGATDKYAPATNAPIFPLGYAAPDARPLLPQAKAELMAGRIPIDEQRAEMPASLRDVVIGPTTALEIGWKSPGKP